MAEPSLIECTAETITETDPGAVHALTMQELVIDVHRRGPTLTAEACCSSQAGVNLCLHAASDEDPQKLVSELIEGIERLGVSALRYRVVREDLPPQIKVEYRRSA